MKFEVEKHEYFGIELLEHTYQEFNETKENERTPEKNSSKLLYRLGFFYLTYIIIILKILINSEHNKCW